VALLGHSGGIKASPIIPHLDGQLLVVLGNAHPDLARLGVPGNVQQPFGDTAHDRLTECLRNRREGGELRGTGNAGRRGEAKSLLFERVLQIRGGHGLGSQIVNGGARGSHRSPSPSHGLDDDLKSPLLSPCNEMGFDGFQLQDQAG